MNEDGCQYDSMPHFSPQALPDRRARAVDDLTCLAIGRLFSGISLDGTEAGGGSLAPWQVRCSFLPM